MKQLIELFNKKYGATYGVIDDSIDNEDVYKVYKMIKTLCSDDQEIMEMLNKIKLPSPRTAKESIEKVNINVSGGLSKEYVDDKTEILPVKNNYIILEDAVPSRTEVASDGFEYYIFDSLQNEDMIISAVKYNLNVTFNDGSNDRTMDLIIKRSLKDGVFCEKDGFAIQVIYSETNHAIEMILVNANDYTQYSILKATLNYDSYSNLLQDYHIESIDYDKIKGVPIALNRIANYEDFTLEGKEYYELYDNLSIWDANKFNERLDENSGVKRNEFFKLLGKDKYTMRIKQKDSEGIGFGQHISIDNSKNVHIVADAGVDVIIKIYNSTTKELIETLNYCEAGFYKTRSINKDYLNGVTSIFIAFTVKDSTESFYGNTYVNDLIVHYDSSFLVKEEILTKTNTKEYIPSGDYNPATKKYVDEKFLSNSATHTMTLKLNTNELNFIQSRVTNSYNDMLELITKEDLSSIIDNSIETIIFEGLERYPYKVVGAYRGFNLKEHVLLELAIDDSEDDYYTVHRLKITYSDDYGKCFLSSYYGDLTEINALPLNNTTEYTPREDYNPATKKYVDEKTASIDTTINNNLPSNGALTLTTNKFQTTTLATPTEIQLPEVTGYAEIHLFFTGVSGVTIGTGTTNVKWENQPTIEDNKTYELIFTYINDTIGWVAKTVVYN